MNSLNCVIEVNYLVGPEICVVETYLIFNTKFFEDLGGS